MTDEELITFLRTSTSAAFNKTAADRIEALVKEVQRWHGLFDEKHNLMLQQKARAERLEAALREIASNGNAAGRNPQLMADIARAALSATEERNG